MSSIIVVFPKIENAKSIRNLLVRYGYTVTAVCSTGAQALNAVDGAVNGIVICGYRFPDMMYHQLKENLPPKFEMLLLGSPAVISQCRGDDVLCVSMPLKAQDLIDTINMIERNFTRRKKRERENPKVRDSKEQATILEAKRLLMERNHMSEEEAHRYIQKTSMNNGTNMVETAEMVISIMHM